MNKSFFLFSLKIQKREKKTKKWTGPLSYHIFKKSRLRHMYKKIIKTKQIGCKLKIKQSQKKEKNPKSNYGPAQRNRGIARPI